MLRGSAAVEIPNKTQAIEIGRVRGISAIYAELLKLLRQYDKKPTREIVPSLQD